MKGILLKDFYSLRRTIWLYLILMLFLGVTQGEGGTTFALFYAVMLPVNLIAIDERSRFDRFAPVLPIGRLQNVLDKYIVSYICMAFAPVSGLLCNAVSKGAFTLSPMMLFGLAICLLSQAITLPLTFRFGIEQGRMIYMIAIIVQAAFLGALGFMVEGTRFLQSAPLGLFAFAVALLVNFGSIFLSAKLYEQRLLA